jgi:hypothetical protein
MRAGAFFGIYAGGPSLVSPVAADEEPVGVVSTTSGVGCTVPPELDDDGVGLCAKV